MALDDSGLNTSSSRSHVFFNIELTSKTNGRIRVSLCSLVDFAGNEPREINAGVIVDEKILIEANEINKSHTMLNTVIGALNS